MTGIFWPRKTPELECSRARELEPSRVCPADKPDSGRSSQARHHHFFLCSHHSSLEHRSFDRPAL